MDVIPPNDKEKIFGLLQAREAFKNVIRICAYAVNNNIEHGHELCYSLLVSAHVIYSRPFLMSYGFGKLDDILVPDKYKKTHEAVLEYRNRVFAHRQLKEKKKGEDRRRVLEYHAVYYVVKGKTVFTAVAEDHPGIESFKEIHALCRELLRKVRYHSQKLNSKYYKLLPKEEGTYKMIMDDAALSNFVKVADIELSDESQSKFLTGFD